MQLLVRRAGVGIEGSWIGDVEDLGKAGSRVDASGVQASDEVARGGLGPPTMAALAPERHGYRQARTMAGGSLLLQLMEITRL